MQKVDDNLDYRPSGEELQRLINYAKKEFKIERSDLPLWVMPALRLREAGESVVLGLRRFSERTLKVAPIFDAVLVSYDMRHSSTQNVKNDHGEKKDHYGSLDIFLRHRAHSQLRTPIFLQLQQQEPNWRNVLKAHNGKQVHISFNNGLLYVDFELAPEREQKFAFSLKTINN